MPKGYAIVNIDSRGAFDSEGVMAIMGTQEAEDGYDAIEHIAKQPWCTGKVGLAGNSHLVPTLPEGDGKIPSVCSAFVSHGAVFVSNEQRLGMLEAEE